MLSSPLENIILKTKLLDMGSPEAFLALALDRPRLSDIGDSILSLKEMGGLLRTCNGEMHDTDGDISFIGRVMVEFCIASQIFSIKNFLFVFSRPICL